MTPNVLILVGGLSERMGRNKALIERPDGTRQIDHIVSLVRSVSSRVFLSSRDSEDHGTGLPVIPDLNPGEGPVGALASAAASGHSGPWLVIGCDLFLLDAATLQYLLARHDPSRPATAFRNRIDSCPEPLCAIYGESSIQASYANLTGNRCARRFLESLNPQLLDLPHPAALDNTNTPTELAEVFQKLTHGVTAKSVSILYFAALREQRGVSSEAVETLACTAGGLYEELSFRHRLKLSLADLRVARNGEFSEWDATVSNADEFVFIPPVAGG